MRKLVWMTLGFAAACAGSVCIISDRYKLLLACACGLVMVISALFFRRWAHWRLSALAALGCALGFLWCGCFGHFYLDTVQKLDGKMRYLTVVCGDYSYETRYGCAVEGLADVDGKPCQIRVYLDEPLNLVPGDAVIGDFRLKLTTPGSEQEIDYYSAKGIFLLGYQEGELRVRGVTNRPIWCYPAVLRQHIREILQDSLPEDVVPFGKALLLGDTRDLSYETDTDLKVSGIRHIVAVSGLHISILYGLICILTARKRFLTALLGIPLLAVFAAVAGFSPSVVRACVMVGLMMGASLVQREYDPPSALAFAVLVMLVINPLTVRSVSLQLSAGCVAGILLFSAPMRVWLENHFPGKGRWKIWLCSGISVTFASMSLTTPLCARCFGMVSLASPITNLLTLWVVTVLFGGLLAICVLSLFSAGMAAMLGICLAWPMRYVLAVAKLLGSFPLSAVYTGSIWIVIWLAYVYVLLACLLFVKQPRPGVLVSCAVMGMCLALLLSWIEPMEREARLTVLDVGQGQSILFQSEGRTFLIDCGGDSDTQTADLVAETLLGQGISRLDGIFLTHFDRDHAGAVENLLTRVETRCLFLPLAPGQPDFDVETHSVSEDLLLSFGNTKITVFAPVLPGSYQENSLCILLETESCAILITGDRSAFGERMLLRRSKLPDVDVLVAGHHGAADASCEELLEAVCPEIVLISVGQDNFYGHPSPETLQRLNAFGCTVYRTDQCGTIIYRR